MTIVLKKARNIVTEPSDHVDAKLSLVDVVGSLEDAPFTAVTCEFLGVHAYHLRAGWPCRRLLHARGSGDTYRG